MLPLILVGIAWIQESIDQFLFAGLWNLPFGPGLPFWGILTAPFSHSGFSHLLSNTLIFLPTSWLVLSKGFRDYIAIWIAVLLLQIPVALFWPTAIHGLSGVVYGILGYLMLIGFLEKRPLSLFLSILCIYLYGSSLFALIPSFSPAGVSWIGHLSGFTAGILTAFFIYYDA